MHRLHSPSCTRATTCRAITSYGKKDYIKFLNDPVLANEAMPTHVSPTMVKEFMTLIRAASSEHPPLSDSTMEVFRFLKINMCGEAYVAGKQSIENVLDQVMASFAAVVGKAGALVYNSNGYFTIAYDGKRYDANTPYWSLVDLAGFDMW